MSGFAWMIFIVFLLTLLGSLTLILITVKYYWGERGAPPLTGEEKRRKREAELRLRAGQIEQSRKNPWKTRSSSFWDNRKISSK